MNLRNHTLQSQSRYYALLEIKKELSKISDELLYFQMNIETYFKNITPQHVWTQNSEASRNHVNFKVRVKLEKILDAISQKRDSKLYYSIHAILLVLALYWPRNEFELSDTPGDLARPQCPIRLEKINIEDPTKVYIFSDGRLYSDAIFSSLSTGKNPLTNLKFRPIDIAYNEKIKLLNDLPNQFSRLRWKWSLAIGSIYSAIAFPAGYFFSKTMMLAAESRGYLPFLEPFLIMSLMSATVGFASYGFGILGAKISFCQLEESTLGDLSHNRAILLFNAIQKKLALTESTVNISARLNMHASSEIKTNSEVTREPAFLVDNYSGALPIANLDFVMPDEEAEVAPPIRRRVRSG